MSAEFSTEQLNKTFANVRQAYRLVGEYQRRLFSIMHFIEERFPEVAFLYWSPARWGTPPTRGSNSLSKWAIDGIPYYTFSILYVEPIEKNETQSSWMLEIHHRVDSALYDDAFVIGSTEPSLAELSSSSDEVSELHLVAWLRHSSAEDADWRWDGWNGYDWPSEDDVLEPVEDATFSRLRHRLDLSAIVNRDDLEQAVDRFRNSLLRNGFPLKPADPQD